MNAVSKLISKIVRSEHTNVNDNKKMITDKKYLLISDWSIKLSLKIILFVYIWFGLLWDNKSFSEICNYDINCPNIPIHLNEI